MFTLSLSPPQIITIHPQCAYRTHRHGHKGGQIQCVLYTWQGGWVDPIFGRNPSPTTNQQWQNNKVMGFSVSLAGWLNVVVPCLPNMECILYCTRTRWAAGRPDGVSFTFIGNSIVPSYAPRHFVSHPHFYFYFHSLRHWRILYTKDSSCLLSFSGSLHHLMRFNWITEEDALLMFHLCFTLISTIFLRFLLINFQ